MNKFDIIERYIIGQDVLDIGSVSNQLNPKESLFDNIKKYAKSTKGIDIQKSDNPNIYQTNAENFNLRKKFDVIVAGEIIEHLSNPGNFLDCALEHLKQDGVLIITTPNAHGILFQIEDRFFHNKEHKLVHTEATLRELIRYHGFKVREFYFVHQVNLFIGKIMSLLILGSFKRTLVAVCRKVHDRSECMICGNIATKGSLCEPYCKEHEVKGE